MFDDERDAVSEPKKKLYPGIMAGLVGSNLFDAATTQSALNRGNVREANPALAPIVNNPASLYALKGGIGAAEAYGLNKLSQAGHPKLAKGLGILGMAVPTLAGMHNMRVGR
jgi:hypothetical protein